jgi:hypothetical protein
MTAETDLFTEFESIGEILGFVLHKEGPEALEELLDNLIEDNAIDADTLYGAANGLVAAGMVDGAEMVAKAADGADGLPDPAPALIASIMSDPIKGNVKARLASLYRQGRCTMDDLVVAGIGSDTLY